MMKPRPLATSPWFALGIIAFVAAVVAGLLTVLTGPGPAQLPHLGSLAPFDLTRSDGRPFTGRDLTGRPHLVNFVFARCPGPCVTLAQRFREFQDLPGAAAAVGLVTFTVDPESDTPAALQAYAEHLGADPRRWAMVTGPKDKLYDLIRSGFKVSAMENDDPHAPLAEQFIHTTKVVLLDRNGTIRGYYDGQEASSYDRILEDLGRL
jgi:protein SCO1